MKPLADLVGECDVLLLDFDGPVCSVFGGAISNRDAAKMLAALINSSPPEAIADTRDPFEVLQYAATLDRATAKEAERRFTEIEVEAVRTATPTPGAAELIQGTSGRLDGIAFVSNNSAAAVESYLTAHSLCTDRFQQTVFARTSPDLSLLKPSPHLLNQAVAERQFNPATCLFVGDSVTDIVASRAAGIPVLAYANRPEKVERLAGYAPDGMITSMRELYREIIVAH